MQHAHHHRQADRKLSVRHRASAVVLLGVAAVLAACSDTPPTASTPTGPSVEARQSAGGNALNAQACRKNGWQGLVTSSGAPFTGQGACGAYGAQGGTLFKAQTITFGALADKTFGDADFAVSATASSGLPVSFSASGDCTVSGATVHLVAAGSCTITAHQPGDATWYAAPDVAQSFAIAGSGPFVCGESQLTDIDGNTYNTVQIDTQCWMAENLRTTTYANGDGIPNPRGNIQWGYYFLTTGAWVHYNHDSQFENPYGKLYSWYTVADPRNVCPTGWHVPSDAEWSTLINYLDPNADGGSIGPNTAGGKMKSTGTQYWASPNTDATNESGFSGLPGGYRYYFNEEFIFIGQGGFWWSSTEAWASNAWIRHLRADNGNVSRSASDKSYGFSVRCLRD